MSHSNDADKLPHTCSNPLFLGNDPGWSVTDIEKDFGPPFFFRVRVSVANSWTSITDM